MESSSILKYIEPKKKLVTCDSLLKHPLRQECHQIDKKKGFYWKKGNMTFSGITKKLKRSFYPDFKYNSKKKPRKGTCSSISIGTRVHEEICHIVNCEKTGICECEKSKKKKLHNFTKKAIKKFKELEITLEEAEVTIFSPLIKVGTRIDLIGSRWKGTDKERMVAISLKTGYPGKYKKPKKMLAPLDSLDSIPHNHNQLQGMTEHIILEKEYQINLDDYIIMYLGKDEPIVQPLEKWCKDEIFRKILLNSIK